ncbi:MAG: DNA-3-methyladenine glycosylase I [Rhodobacteraceae bacterium]|nr:DNA-3-methyladenine glycosylase I [Paracoccaceae bacterium]
MRDFGEILDLAVARKGSVEAVLEGATAPLDAQALAAIPDAQWLAAMARGIFQAGISWQVVDRKWPGIEEAFEGFDPGRVSMYEGERIDALVGDPRVIRSGPKIVAIRDNAAFLRQVAAESGSFARRVADWPVSDFAGLLGWLGRNGSRLGGTTGQYVMRHMGKDSFVLSASVVARLQAEGVIAGAAGSARSMAAIQAAFNRWQAESGRSFNEIGRVLARSIDAA